MRLLVLTPDWYVNFHSLDAGVEEKVPWRLSHLYYYDQTAKPITWTSPAEKREQKLGTYLR